MHRNAFRTAVLFPLFVLLGLLLVACDRGPTKVTATIPAPAIATPVEPVRTQNTVLSAFETADFSGPGTCTMCHEGLSDEAGVDVSLTTDWRSTMMANAAKDPVWQAKMSSEVARLPALQAVIENKCVSCHMPMARTQAEVEGQAVAALGGGFFDPAHPLHESAIEGVSCTLCHQVTDVSLGTMESFTGGYSVDTATEPPNRQAFGPYEQPFGQPMQMHTGFDPVYGAHTDAAELCATCHNLYTPYVDAQGNVLGEFPEQTPYTEWQNSTYGGAMPCQGCHMPKAKGGVVISQMPGRLGPRQPFYQHWFVGGNALMLRILAGWGGELRVTADPAHFDTTEARVIDQVSQRTARLTVKSLGLEDGVLTASLEIAALTGHKFPTSFPSRRAWLHVTVADAGGNVIWESGARNVDGTISGNAADSDPTAFEPHYDVITQADQVQIYEPIMGDNEGAV
ncbi:MAG: cytochrome c family protein, partial [Anaerolineae bacterium]|nr:cytochrome c family protein [Anaerolineae bacterium]